MKWHCVVFFLVLSNSRNKSFIGHVAIIANEYNKFCETSRRATNTNSHALRLKCHLPCALVISLNLQSARPTCGAMNHLRRNTDESDDRLHRKVVQTHHVRNSTATYSLIPRNNRTAKCHPLCGRWREEYGDSKSKCMKFLRAQNYRQRCSKSTMMKLFSLCFLAVSVLSHEG